MISVGADIRPFKVMVISDSIGVGTGDSLTVATGGFKTTLFSGINSRLKRTATFVGAQFNVGYMCGASGQTVAQITADPYCAVQLAQYTPDVIFLHIGTNDCTQLQSGGTPTLATTRANLTTLLNNIRSTLPACIVFIARIIDNNTAHTQVVNFNTNAIDIDVAARSDYTSGLVQIVDLYTTVGLYSVTNYADATHPNSAGYALMAGGWQTAFNLLY